MALGNADVSGGFSDAVLDAQANFAALMNAMAQPGSVHELTKTAEAPEALDRAIGSVALTLFDNDTRVKLELGEAGAPVIRWLGFHTGARFVDADEDAQFIILDTPEKLGFLSRYNVGTQDYPDRSATVIIRINGFRADRALTLAGPGIMKTCQFSPEGLPETFQQVWHENTALFPRGVDLIFASDDAVAAMPRTTRLLTEVL